MLALKKPKVIEVHRWTRNDGDDGDSFGNDNMARWLGKAYRYIQNGLAFTAIDGRELIAQEGDYIAKQDTFYGPDFWPIAQATFLDTYDVVKAPNTAKAGQE